uniref:Boophilin-G2 (Trinotate prediction) n=1 Tax=Myxobolus squamalis TaxID=59785 RepID=A0A6B2G4F8_MYXSQ
MTRYIILFIIFQIRFATSIPQNLRKCYLPVNPGKCAHCVTRWYFNSKTFGCVSFKYGGCGGNGNNFQSLDDCIMSCPKAIKEFVCTRPPSQGTFCGVPKTRFFYSWSKNSCQPFIYYGCAGNENNFRYINWCQDYCKYDR